MFLRKPNNAPLLVASKLDVCARNYPAASTINSTLGARTCERNFTTLSVFPKNSVIISVSSSPWKKNDAYLVTKQTRAAASLCFLRLLNYYPRARSKSPRFVKRLRAQVQE
jgi:hypothetical protein